jgi:hypothetical protein
MTTRKRSWKTVAKRVLGKTATQNIGDGSGGQFALVTPCRDQIDFSLWATREEAKKYKAKLKRGGCCGGCWPNSHYIIDLSEAAEGLNEPSSWWIGMDSPVVVAEW